MSSAAAGEGVRFPSLLLSVLLGLMSPANDGFGYNWHRAEDIFRRPPTPSRPPPPPPPQQSPPHPFRLYLHRCIPFYGQLSVGLAEV